MSSLDASAPQSPTSAIPEMPKGLVAGGPISDFVKEISGPLHLNNRQAAAAMVASYLQIRDDFGATLKIKNDDQANTILTAFLQFLLDGQRYVDAARLLWKPNIFSGEPRSVKMIWDALFQNSQVMIPGSSSMGKCVEESTPVLLASGKRIPAKEVKIGDILVGDDGAPRTVLRIDTGEDELFSVTSLTGTWKGTANHQLVLECAVDRKNGHGGKVSNKAFRGAQVEPTIAEFVGWSETKKRCFKQIKSGSVPFPEQEVQFDPYVYGCWLGDGSTDMPAITKTPGPMLEYWKSYFEGIGYRNVPNPKKGSSACTWFARDENPADGHNRFTGFVRGSKDESGRRIRPEYLQNSEAIRLQVLAGFIDTDGTPAPSCGFSITTKYDGLKDDLVFLCRSLGLRTVEWKRTHTIKSLNFSGEYWTVYISGPVSKIPCKQKRAIRDSSRSTRLERIEVTPAGRGKYVGILVDGNHRFLLGDFTVVHNSYSLGVWMMLDWLRDPQFTNILVVGPSENHLERNLFSHLVKLHRASSIPIPGELRQLEISIDSKNKDSGIFGVVVPVGKKAAGRLQGVKVLQRPTPHPQFGPLSRVRVVLEEAENIPVGIWEDVTNIVSNTNGIERFKVAAPFNPKDPNGPCAIRCEPDKGWESVDCETSEEWMSKRGWKVVRLDAYKSENVIAGSEIFFGMQTKMGLEKSIQNAGGVGTAGYYTFCRGWYPPQGVDLAVIPQHLMTDLVGTYEFSEPPTPTAAMDVALEGGDNAIIILGKVGRATGWRKAPIDGKPQPVIPFLDTFNQPTSRDVLQVDQIFTAPKGNTLDLVSHATRICRGAMVRGEHFGVDRTGNGAGVHDLLVANFNSGVKGINPSTAPTERKILAEDTFMPCDEYSYLLSELWFALRKYIEFGFVKISPTVPTDPLHAELTGRRFLLGGKKIKVESKKEYKSRGNKSPDRADALTILVHVVRLNSGGPPSVTRGGSPEEDYGTPFVPTVGVTDRRDYL